MSVSRLPQPAKKLAAEPAPLQFGRLFQRRVYVTLALVVALASTITVFTEPALRLSYGSWLLERSLEDPENSAKLQQAIVFLEDARLQGSLGSLAYRRLGQAYMAADRPEESVAAFEQAHRLSPDSLLIRDEWATALEASGRHQDALALWDELLSPKGGVRGVAENARLAGDFSMALKWYQRLLQAGQEVASTMYYTRFQAAQALGDEATALEELKAAVGRDNGWESSEMRLAAFTTLGTDLYDQGRYEDAVTNLRVAVQASADVNVEAEVAASARRYLGLALWQQGKIAEAHEQLRRAYEQDPSAIWSQIHYAKILYLYDRKAQTRVLTILDQVLEQVDHEASYYRNFLDFWRWQNRQDLVARLCRSAAAQGVEGELRAQCTVP